MASLAPVDDAEEENVGTPLVEIASLCKVYATGILGTLCSVPRTFFTCFLTFFSVTNFTTPSDDANFDPPKFKNWVGRPKVFSLYGLSSWTFIFTAFVLLYIWRQCDAAGAGSSFSIPYQCSSGPVEGLMYIFVAFTSFFGDVRCLGHRSYWHAVDRWLAQGLIAGNVFLIFSLMQISAECVILAIGAYVVPLFCYTRSYKARDWRLYEVWHTLWHAMSQTNKALLSGILYVASNGDEDLTAVSVQMTAIVLCVQVLVCGSVWANVDLFLEEEKGPFGYSI